MRRALAGSALLLLALLTLSGYAEPPAVVTWPMALGCWSVGAGWVATRAPRTGLGPADLVTLARATATCAAAGLVAADHRALLFPLCVAALALDAVDGPVARRTGTASAFGRRLDGEADALLMLVLSVAVAQHHGAWVLVLGLLRYAFGAAGALLPWLGRPLPLRWWRKVGAAVAGIALVAGVSRLLPDPVVTAGLVLALALLVESFGRDVLWLWRRRSAVVPAPLPAGRLS